MSNSIDAFAQAIRREDPVTVPTPASLSESPIELTPTELKMTPAQLTKAATECRTVARGLRKQADLVSVANVRAAIANPATELGRAATVVCGGHLPTAIRNTANDLDLHANALDEAARSHVADDELTADGYRQAQAGTSGTSG
jgi:hypothetical protein